MNFELTSHDPFQYAYEIIQFTDLHLFLTGSAGTGKTYFLQQLSHSLQKNYVILAPTGVAALQAGGQTIHSFFKLPPGLLLLPEDVQNSPLNEIAFPKWKSELIRQLDTIIIDEVSMLRADTLDAINFLLQKVRRNPQPFGGVQMVFIGDLFQLPPVISEQEKNGFFHFYSSPYFFNSRSFGQINFVAIELKTIYRQSDAEFIKLLENIRQGKINREDLQKINSRTDPYFDWFFNKDYIVLTTHNKIVEEINQTRLAQLKGKPYQFEAQVEGDFPEKYYPTEYNLTLKEGARIMFLKNDLSPFKKYYNGKIGTISRISEYVLFIEVDDQNEPIELERYTWQNIQYKLDLDRMEIQQEVLGSFTQFPVKLAWAMTIHKSQGLTFSKVYVDLHQVFTHGQVYVALSRCTSLDGLLLRNPLRSESIRIDQQILEFYQNLHVHYIKPEEVYQHKIHFWLHQIQHHLNIEQIHQNLQLLLSNEDIQPVDPLLKTWFLFLDTKLYKQCYFDEVFSSKPIQPEHFHQNNFIGVVGEKTTFIIQYTSEVYFWLSFFKQTYSSHFHEPHRLNNLFEMTLQEIIKKIFLLQELRNTDSVNDHLIKLCKKKILPSQILFENEPILLFDNQKYMALRWWRNHHLSEMISNPVLFISDPVLYQLSLLSEHDIKTELFEKQIPKSKWREELFSILTYGKFRS